MTDHELLWIQAEGSFDGRGRVAGEDGIAIACSADQQSLWIGAEVPDDLASALMSTFDGAPGPVSPAQPPPALELCGRLLDRSWRPSGHPHFLIGPDTHFTSGVHIERSDAWNGQALLNANPGNWQPREWVELLEGRLGPWTMATDGELVVSICHTPVPLTPRTAECGVWTRPGHRGRGHAAAVTSAWAEILRPSGRHLFYSTGADNFSSQRVTQRLRLRPLGWTWHLGTVRRSDQLHPLCSLRRT